MKRLYKTTFAIVLILALGSCKKFLEREPINRTGKNTLFETVEGASQGLTGSYNRLLDYYKNEFGMYGDVASDNVIRSEKNAVMLPQFNYQSSSDEDPLAVGHIWLDIYETLNGVNNILSALPELKSKYPDQAATLQSIEGQALVIRALCHFDVCRVYAQPYNYTADASHIGVPVLLKTPSPGSNVPRKTVKEVYDQVIADLTAGAALLRDGVKPAPIRIGYHAALALLSRVYLYKGDWAQSANYASMVINSNAYELASTEEEYKASFLLPAVNAPRIRENIFQLTNANLPIVGAVFGVFSDAVNARYFASLKLVRLYDAEDIRAVPMYTVPTGGENKGKYISKKYGDGVVTEGKAPLVQVIRLSEVYLNRAEAQINDGKTVEAKEDLRIIMQRALPSKTITIATNSPEELKKLIADERTRELAFENHRIFDIVRRKENLVRGADCNASVCALTYPNDKFVLPLPSREIQANKGLTQNPGYN